MATAIPDFPSFDVDTDLTGLAQQWKKWLARYENLIIALDITDPRCKQVLLLHYAGHGVHDIFDTLPDNPATATTHTDGPDNPATPAVDNYQKVVAKLDAYFNPSRNTDYETCVFRQARQKQGETLDVFQSQLRQPASTCKFTDIDREIKAQVVAGCLSTRFCRKALCTPNITLTDLLNHRRALETSESQDFRIEKQASPEVNQLSLRSARGKSKHHKSRQTTQCYNCGGDYPHKKGRTSCPAYGAECGKCR